jgi:hypothetical protein
MGPERRRLLLLVALLVVLLGVLYRAWSERYAVPAPAGETTLAVQGQRAPAATTGAAEPAQSVHLDALNRPRPKPEPAERDPFRFRPKLAPPPPPGGMPGVRGPQEGLARPPGPPPTPPIALKFIGIVEQGAGKPKLAVLTDGLGPPMYGIEGGTVAGRYRIVRIGAESIEMEYLDGRGRQTIRLSGS